MRIEQRRWTRESGWRTTRDAGGLRDAQLVLCFGARHALLDPTALDALHELYPTARLVGGSTAGEIHDIEVHDDSITATALEIEDGRVEVERRRLTSPESSAKVGADLALALPHDGLAHVLVFAEGLHVNGSELADGLRNGLPEQVAVTGGLAGDGAAFQETVVCVDGEVSAGLVAVVGLYGPRLRIGYGSLGGWDPFGPHRIVTRSRGNVLYELDGSSALQLYKSYLGPHASELPASGLMFPLSLRRNDGSPRVVRTILAVDEAEGSVTFAGDVPEGAQVQLMKANVDRLIDGAHGAADASYEALGQGAVDLALLISCVGRKLVLRQRVEEEVESVRQVLGPGAALTGFYSYGEIAPFAKSVKCELHNQTMTITTLAER
ncbi:MAG: hypothetical protein FJ202_11805 [Gemmatimonadetes bacterium]|nr:hypothetical protein [Gemmatimonadota bacterium]